MRIGLPPSLSLTTRSRRSASSGNALLAPSTSTPRIIVFGFRRSSIRHVRRRGAFARQTLPDHRVLLRDAIGVSGQRLQHARVRMQPAPFLPAGEEKRIQLQMLALHRTGDRFEARLLPSAARLAVLEYFIAPDDAG